MPWQGAPSLAALAEHIMSGHKFKVGQTVSFKPSRMGFPASNRECQIVRLLPIEDGNRLYRVKCASESFERVAKESELAQKSAAP
jgi:hypothetical protein